MFRPPKLLAFQIVPTAATIPAGRPRLLRPSRTCVVTFARIGYAIRLTTGNWRNEDLHLARFSTLSAAPCPLEFSLGIKVPGEQGRSGVGAGVASVTQRVAHHKLGSIVWSRLRVGPRLPVTIPRPQIDVGKLILHILKLETLLHRFCVEQLQILDVEDGRFSIHE